MKIDYKQKAIYIGLFLVCITYTMIAPFYPQIAQDKGVPLWLIGVIFSLNPLAYLITALFLGKYMVLIGRKNAVILSFALVSTSMIFLSPIEDTSMNQLIILSLISRACGGIGSGFMFTAVITIFISDYPDKVQIMIGRQQVAIGLGLVLGPIIGGALYFINLLVTMIVVGALILFYSPIAWKMLGTFREYSIKSASLNRVSLIAKPVILI